MNEIEPTHISTIYINNLNDKINLKRLKITLTKQFSHYGRIINIAIHNKRHVRMKGQVFISYDDKDLALKAVEGMNNKRIYRKNIGVSLAKQESDIVLLKNGGIEDIEQRKKSKAEKLSNEVKEDKTPTNKDGKTNTNKKNKEKIQDISYWKSLPPNDILLLQNLNNHVDEIKIEDFFENFNGFNKVRLIKARNLSFIEFNDETLSSNCLNSIHDENLKEIFGDQVIISFAKK